MRLFLITFFLFSAISHAADLDLSALPPPSDRTIDFIKDVQPIFARTCYGCHGPDKQKSNYRLDAKPYAFKGGDIGKPIVAGDSAHSPLIHYIAGIHPEITMPPKGEALSADQVGLIRAWIDQGANWPADADKIKVVDRADWWSLKPIVRPAIPQIANELQAQVRNPIDAFILAKLSSQHLTPTAEADRRTLIRRVSFDLIGLPPSADEIDAFVSDTDPNAHEKLVDRLLASPRYGERWGRRWLDAVHYGDTHGYDKDKIRPNAWPYRDYVIRSLNEDKAYTRFVREQLAGDYFYPNSSDGIVGLGFIAAGPWDFVGQVELREGTIDKAITRNLDRDDMVTVTMNTFVSLTAQCARCHNHKFDPILQEDYYSLQAVFAGVERGDRAYDTDGAFARRRGVFLKQLADLQEKKAQINKLDATTRQRLVEIDHDIGVATSQLQAQGMVYAAVPTKPRAVFLLHRGSEKQPEKEMGPGTVSLSYVPELRARFKIGEEAERRAALANWITEKKNPLIWRSIVNRVWQYHFGRGIVETPNDFGHMGALPSHPELLDWLATEFRDGGEFINAQSIKSLHRLIVTSATYRQACTNNEKNANIDSGNQYLWRMNRARLEAETIRDSVLSVAGKLDLTTGGPGFRDFGFKDDHSPHYAYNEYNPDDPATHRRSIYRLVVRSAPDPFMETLDCADPSQIVAKRNETLTPLQALALLNNPFMVKMAEHFAERAEKMGQDTPSRIDAACRLAYGRSATPLERRTMVGIAEKYGLPSVCRVILNSNEFVFVD